MKCVICKQGDTAPDYTNITIERDDIICVIKQVPAEVCTNCGEAYLEAQTTRTVMDIANKASLQGVQIEIRRYNAA